MPRIAVKEDLHPEERSHLLSEAEFLQLGAITLLGFQFHVMFIEEFAHLPFIVKMAHAGSIVFLIITVIILIAPVAHHQLVERTRHTEEITELTGGIIIAAMATLAMGISIEMFVAGFLLTGSLMTSLVTSLTILLIFYISWFGSSLVLRKKIDI